MKKTILILMMISEAFVSQSQSAWTNVKDHGADPSGSVKCTKIISDIITDLSAKGGGTVFFPVGTFLTGPIIMKSNITIWLEAGAIVKFSDDFDDYLPMVPSRWEEVRLKNFVSQIYAYQCENISIRGRGHFEGQGQKWWDFKKTENLKKLPESKWQTIFKKENAELLKRNERIRSNNNFLRPPMVTTYECKNVLIEGVSFSNPPYWTIMPSFSDNVTITGIRIENTEESPNTDGIDPSSCRNVHISNSIIEAGDDCLVIKSGRDEDGREAASPSENITITNCTMLKGHGGVSIGSEMSGSVRGITISNCVFDGTDRGIRIKTMRGRGGVVEDIRVSNVVMKNIVNEGIIITMRYKETEPEPLSERTPAVNNVHLSNISIRSNKHAIAIYGLEEKEISQISMSDMQIFSKKGILVENGSDISFHDIRMEIKEGSAFEAKDSKRISYDMITVTTPLLNIPYLKLSNCKDVRITNCYQPEAIPLLISEDDKSSDIYIFNNILPRTIALVNNKGRNIISQNNLLKK